MRMSRKEIMKAVRESEGYKGWNDFLNSEMAFQNLLDNKMIEGNDKDGYELTSLGMKGYMRDKPEFEDEEVPK